MNHNRINVGTKIPILTFLEIIPFDIYIPLLIFITPYSKYFAVGI